MKVVLIVPKKGENMPTTTSAKKKTNPLIFIGIGCVVLIVLISAISALVGKFFAKNLIQGAIESKTGIKTDLSDIEKGKMTITDTKTGATVDVGSNKIPDAFPKDFPVYPGAKVTSSLTGAQSGRNDGFWLTLSTPDAVDKVASYYKSQLAGNGWTVESTFTTGDTTSETVQKADWNGSIAISRDAGSKETQIVIILGQDSASGE